MAASITCNEQMIKGEETEPRFGPGRLWPPCTAASSWPGPVSSATASARAGAAAESLARAPGLRENKREVRLVQPTGRSTEGFRLEKIFHVAKSNREPAKPAPHLIPNFSSSQLPPRTLQRCPELRDEQRSPAQPSPGWGCCAQEGPERGAGVGREQKQTPSSAKPVWVCEAGEGREKHQETSGFNAHRVALFPF